MKRLVQLAVIAFVAVSALACQSAPAGLSDQDKAAIRKLCDDAVKMVNPEKTDWAAYVKLYYAEDATVLPPNMPPAKGRAAIQAFMESMPPISDFKPEPVEIDGRGDLAYVRGNYSMTLHPPGAPPVVDRGKYIEIHKKQADGSWKSVYDSFSSDLPPAGLLVSFGTMAADANAETKRLADTVGLFKFDGTTTMDPKAPPAPMAMTLSCGWFAGGRHVVCQFTGTMEGAPMTEVFPLFYDASAKSYVYYSVVSNGASEVGKLAIESGSWIYTGEVPAAGKLAKMKFTVSNLSAAGGPWKYEMSVGGGPWRTVGEGKYAAVK